MGIATELLAILVCPGCKGKLLLTEDGDGLFCAPCNLVYPIREGIPVMLPDAAVKGSGR